MTMTTKITYQISSKNFQTGLKYAKKFNGVYNPEAKTWTIAITSATIRDHMRAPGAYGLIPVTPNWATLVEEANI